MLAVEYALFSSNSAATCMYHQRCDLYFLPFMSHLRFLVILEAEEFGETLSILILKPDFCSLSYLHPIFFLSQVSMMFEIADRPKEVYWMSEPAGTCSGDVANLHPYSHKIRLPSFRQFPRDSSVAVQ